MKDKESPFTVEETEALRGDDTCLESQMTQVRGRGLETKSHSRGCFLLLLFFFFYFIYLFIFFVFLPFLGLLPQHMEVPSLGV